MNYAPIIFLMCSYYVPNISHSNPNPNIMFLIYSYYVPKIYPILTLKQILYS